MAPLRPRVVKKLGRALGASLVWSESTAAGHVVPGSSDLLRPIEDGTQIRQRCYDAIVEPAGSLPGQVHHQTFDVTIDWGSTGDALPL